MMVRCILVFALSLGAWAQSASARPERHVAPAAVQKAVEIAACTVAEDLVAIGGEHSCGCPAAIQNAQSAISESSKCSLAPYLGDSGTIPNLSNPDSIALAQRARTSRLAKRLPGRAPYLFISHLRQ
jgi:hypothetical protein